MKPMDREQLGQRGDKYNTERKDRLKKLEENRIQKAKEEEDNYIARLDEIAKKYPKIPTLIVPEDELDEVLNENFKMKQKRQQG